MLPSTRNRVSSSAKSCGVTGDFCAATAPLPHLGWLSEGEKHGK